MAGAVFSGVRVKSGKTMIFACTRLNWQIHLPDRLITKAHKSANLAAERVPKGSNIRTADGWLNESIFVT
jgi:hypothetical protein